MMYCVDFLFAKVQHSDQISKRTFVYLTFSSCSGLTSVTIPNSVTSIGDRAFYWCDGLTSVTIGNSVESIGNYAFEWCSGLTSVTIPNSVTTIGIGTFSHCHGLTSVTIPNSVTSIGSYAFENCPIASIIIPSSVVNIGMDVFRSCEKLPVENNVRYADKWAVGVTDKSLKTYVLKDNTVAIVGTFDGCTNLTSVTIPNSVTSISGGFSGCSGLTSVTIPNSVTSIEGQAFYGCSGLTSVTIPNSVTSIGEFAFWGCSGLTSVTIPNSVTSIGHGAFLSCSGLISVTIPNSVTSIGSNAFDGCSGLTSVTIPNSVTSIGWYAFSSCSGLTSVTIGNSVTSIEGYAFSDCPELLDVYCYAEKVPSTNSDAFYGSYPEYATLHVPDASIDSYKATTPWSVFVNIVGLSGEEPEQPEVEKCATPVVTYAEGKLSFSCETEGTNYVTKLVAEDAKEYYDAEIELSATYNIEVFATKANYENSDTVSVALVWVENGEVNEETGVISVPAAPVLVQGNGGILTVSGVVQNTEVAVYTIDGMEVDRAVASDGTATIYTGLQSGTIVVVKFGNKSVKVRI